MPTPTLTRLHESAPFGVVARPAEGPGRLRIRIISAGVGSSGVYPAETLKAAAEARVFAAGTHMFLDHPTESEAWERPERSVRDLAARLVTDAVYVDEDGGALDADVEVFSAWRRPLAEMADTIGVSIRAAAEIDEADDQGRPVISRIVEAYSVDFVTKAGRGGRVMEVLESARAVERAVRRGVAEATANDRREQLADLVKNAYGADKTWVWVRDFDDETVWFEVESPDDYSTFQQGYSVTDDVATALTGERVEVRAQTTYVPVAPSPADEATSVPSRPAGQSTATESQEDTMATTQIEESRLAQLEKDAGRATALESERDAAVRRAEEAEARAAKAVEKANQATAEKVVREAFDDAGVTAPKTVARLAKAAALTESGDVDVEALKQAAEESAAELAEASGVGTVRGLGGGTTPNDQDDLTEADLDAELARLSGRTVKEA